MEEVQEDVGRWRGRVVVMGDFNSRVGELPNVLLEGKDDERVVSERKSEDVTSDWRGKYLMREMNAAGFVIANGMREVAEYTSIHRTGSSVIDLICIAWEGWHEWGGLKVWGEEESGLNSDHRLVTGVVKVEKRASQEGEVERKAWRRNDKGDSNFWDELKYQSEERMGKWCTEILDKIARWQMEGKDVCEELWKDWLYVHNEVAEEGLGYEKKKKKKGVRKLNLSKEIADMVKKKNELRQQLARKKGKERKELWEKHRKMKVKLKDMARKEKRRREEKVNRELEKREVKNAKEYWGILKTFVGIGKGGREVPREMREGGKIDGKLVGGKLAKKEWVEAFEKLGRANGGDDRYDQEFWEQTRELVEEWGEGEEEGGELDEELTMEEAIGELRRGKAPGVDGVVNEVLKYGGEEMEQGAMDYV
jgi:hypothetical protein